MDVRKQDASRQGMEAEPGALRDSVLASACRAGSADAFAEVERLYSRKLYSTIFRITKNREDAEDALQETFLRAYLAIRSFEGRSSFYSWLTRIAINSALMVLRKHHARAETLIKCFGEPVEDTPPFEAKDPGLNPEQIFDQRQRCANIGRAIERLHSSLRTPLKTRLVHGSSLEEIAQTLDISLPAVKARLHRARLRLSSARAFRNLAPKQSVSSGLRQKRIIAGFQNREPSCMNSNQ
ncbi:MAG: sigma-70 family RNA polymerase sigma factor [Terracidiphilus sp.]